MPVKNNFLQNKKIAIFRPIAGFSTNPSLLCITDELISNGAELDIFLLNSTNYAKISGKFSQYPFPKKLRFWAGDTRATLSNWKWYLKTSAWKSHRILQNKRYDLVFGIDGEGVIAAFDYSQRKNVPFVFLSYEIVFKDELLTVSDIREKEEEINASRNASIIVIQDRWRKRLLSKENGLSENKFVYLPVAPRSSVSIGKTNYLREKFSIHRDKTIILHSGSFEKWTCAKELLDNVNKLPQNIILVIHTSYNAEKNHEYISTIKKSNFKNIILSTKPLEKDEYEKMVSSADIGLVLYKSCPPSKYVQKNIEEIGLSSGKLSYYVKYGIPVICTGQRAYLELLREYKYGENISSFDEMSNAIEKINSNYGLYCKEARRFFLEQINFEIFWPELLRKIGEIIE